MPVQFTNWFALLLLVPALPFFWWQHRRTMTDMSPGRKRLSLLLRCLLVTLLILILAGTHFVRKGESLSVIFLVDGSRSIRDEQRAIIQKYLQEATRGMRTVDKVGLITFAEIPHTQSSPGQPFDPTRLKDPGQTAATNIAGALRQAKNELDTTSKDSGKRIVLLSDGNENAGRALSETPELAASGIVLDTITLPATMKQEALIEKTLLSRQVKIGEPFGVRVVVSSLTPQSATLSLSRDGKPTGDAKRVSLRRGKNVVVFENQIVTRPGFYRYGVSLDAAQDTIAENNRGESLISVRGKPTVLYVADDPALTGFLRSALKDQNIEIAYAPPEAMPASAAAFQQFDSIFLSNVRASNFSGAQLNALQVASRDFGIGFGMVGGENSFGAGGYRGTAIEEMLPVSMDVKKQKRLPSVAVALVIEDLEIPATVNMSIEAAKATMDLLEPIDQVGVLDCNGYGGFGGGPQSPGGNWRIPMQHVTDREAIKAKMQGLTGMGDPPSYDPYIIEAARVLNQTDAKVKHIVFFGDGDAIMEQQQGATAAAIQQIRNMGITISTITSGAMGQKDVQFMATMAYLGGGQNYVAEKPSDLPRLLLKDQQTLSQPPIIEEPFAARPMDGEEVFKGVDWASAPPLLGYNVSNLKPTADLSLITHRNDPLFAGWRYGLGRTVAFMSDDRARWAAQWVGWPGYSKFWAQTMRWTLRSFAPNDYTAQVTLEGNRGHITVDAQDSQGKFVNKLAMRARIAPPGTGGAKANSTLEEPLRQTGPGLYEAYFDAPEIGTYLVNVLQASPGGKGPEKSTVLGLSTAYSPEYRETQPNTYLMTQLAQAAGGRVDPPPQAVFGGDRPSKESPADLTRFLLLTAILLLPFDIAVRRIAVEREDWSRLLAWLRGRKALPTKATAATPELSRLKERKEAVSSREPVRNGEASPLSGAGSTSASETSAVSESSTPSGNARTGMAPERQRRTPVPPPVRPVSRTVGAPGESEPAPKAAAPEPELAPQAMEEAGMSRLMAAKRRAQQRQEKDET